ncbi:winged helix DNA-binding domain-containing protein [Streptomyces sp. NRRL B-24484]|uniref:winged helix DNA-binding domain-containing protein n=1 Tax=Streptomyces sp. NRRL B-24484 TaxID=1463833 RepID=UPI0005BB46D7|nr:winged helix DNA-binding domain-containing protein [Streptomyces sp. NRRL B-24484]
MTAPLTARTLGRALLARQHLLERSTLDAAAMVRHLVGLQAQAAPEPPYLGLLSRTEGFRPEQLTTLLEERAAVRIALQRGTIHLVTAEDCLTLRPLLQPVHDRWLRTSYAKRLPDLDLADPAGDLAGLADRARTLVDAEPLTFQQLGPLLAAAYPASEPAALAQAARCALPLVQVPPRGLWGRGGPAAHTTAEHWLGRPLDPAPALDGLVLRYLAAFGPATAADVQKWSGLTRIGPVLTRLGDRLVRLRDDRGRTLYDLPEAPRPDASVPAPVRLLAPFDNLLLSHADRSRILPEEYRTRVMTVNGIVLGTVLVDGLVAGSWKAEDGVLTVRPFAPLPRGARAGVEEEAARVLAFAGAADGRTLIAPVE